ncbi:acyl-CoA dehydrogenase family protein [Robertmurraya kyonggiensis]|uniref:Acyl-CoA dehydrogenase family protein n=1 Tax=Robertmurraya kyonggiensis TaxID=1037680 RepID=A0A4U1DAH8_9BACI|nr:acyl-CoA dehydrogenase family protein [Robertmurraya kyonggiensis]TKC19542.1 acyl-CoA dehydrogenase family protein [Robertmurraya kyonggiensis]
MTSFLPTDEEKEFIHVAKDIAIDKIRPVAREVEKNQVVDAFLVGELDELGFLALETPENWEGIELPLITQVQILQALSYGDLGVIQGLPGLGDAATLFRLCPDHPLLATYKDDIIHSKKTVALLDLTGNATVTIENKNDGWLINGITQPVRLASFADYIVVLGRDLDGLPLVMWVEVAEQQNLKVEFGDYRLGLLASGLGKYEFENVYVAEELILASDEEALQLIEKIRPRVQLLQAAKEVGLMEAALDYATEYTAGRKAFGQEIAKFQGVSFRIADMAMETRIANHLVWQAALEVDEDKASAGGSVIRALYRAHRSVRYVTDSAVQLLGGHGYVQEYPVEKWMRDAQAQVSLYGREKELLIQRGEQLIGGGTIGVNVR